MSVGKLVEDKLRPIGGCYGLGPLVLFCGPHHFERLDPRADPLTTRGAYLDPKTPSNPKGGQSRSRSLVSVGNLVEAKLRPNGGRYGLGRLVLFCRSRHSERLDSLIDPLTPRAANLDPNPE